MFVKLKKKKSRYRLSILIEYRNNMV